MPVVLRIGGFAFSIYPGDHEPPHVHVRYAGAKVIVTIETGEVRRNRGMKKQDVTEAKRLVHAAREDLLLAWTGLRQAQER
ncbi:MAG TPA: DUF4160 domain-containing protein [Longimicrobiaceae bacterium]|nr:DUF4160 domain-containing protein [Longimicrobiaceae bacterium]